MFPPLSSIGKIVKTHGVDGEMCVVFDVQNIDVLLDEAQCVMIYDEGLPVPFFMASVRTRGSESRLIRFDDIETQQQAQELVGREIYLPAPAVALHEENDSDGLYAADLIGYSVVNVDCSNVIGTITDINDATANALFVVDTPDGEALIPIADEYIVEIDTQQRTITLSLPHGLLDSVIN